MKNPHLLAAFLLALPVAATAQTTPASTTKTTSIPGTQQQTEVTEDLDPATGKVIRRTTRTINVPAGTPASGTVTAPVSTAEAVNAVATDAQVSAFLRRKTVVSTLTAPNLLTAYQLFIERVRADRSNWKAADWTAASAIMSSLNSRYGDLRSSFSLDDKVTIRSQQAEFQTLRTARQLSDQVSDKL